MFDVRKDRTYSIYILYTECAISSFPRRGCCLMNKKKIIKKKQEWKNEKQRQDFFPRTTVANNMPVHIVIYKRRVTIDIFYLNKKIILHKLIHYRDISKWE